MARTPLQLMGLALVLFLAVAAPAAAQTAANPLAGQWHLDGDSPVNPGDPESPRFTPDSSPNGRDFTYGQGGAGYGFPGRFDFFLSSDNPLQTGVLGDFQRVTLIAWVRASSFPATTQVIAGRGVDGVTCQAMPYALRYEGGATDEGVSFSIRRPDGSSVTAPLSGALADDDWHMVAGTFDGTTVRLYVDGAQQGTGTPAGTASIGYGAGGGAFGLDGYAGSACSVAPFSGGIDEVREYDRALTNTEIVRLASPGATSPPELVPDAPPPPPSPGRPRPPFAAFGLSDPKPAAFKPVVFDAGPTTSRLPIRSFGWDITGDGKTDVSCDPQTPVFTTNTLRPSVKAVTLTVVDTAGQSSTATRAISPSSTLLSARERSAIRATGVKPSLLTGTKAVGGLCSTSPAAPKPPVDTTRNGGPPTGCINQLYYGNFKAVGCWRLVTDVTKLPKGERAQVDSNYRTTLFSGTPASPLISTAPAGTLLKNPSKLPSKPLVLKPKAKASMSMVQAALALQAAVANSTFIADGKVRVNGLDVEPQVKDGVRRSVVFVGGGLLATAKAQLASSAMYVAAKSPFGTLTMKRGQLNESFGVGGPASPLGALRIPSKVKLVPGLGIKGNVSASMDRGKLKLGANVSAPKVLGGITSSAKLEASTANGLELDYFKFFLGEAPLGPLVLENLNFEWDGPNKVLTAGLEARILNKVGAGGTIRFKNGDFDSLKVFVESFPGVVVGPGVHLTRVDGDYKTQGPVIDGRATLTVGPNPPPGSGCPKVGVVGGFNLDFNYPATVRVDGTTQLLCFSILSVGASFNEEGYGSFYGRFNPDLSPLPISINAGAKGQIQAPVGARSFNFQIDLDGEGCVDFGTVLGVRFKGCITVEFTASTTAMAACGEIGPVRGGFRLFYPPAATFANPVSFFGAIFGGKRFKLLGDGCNLADYRSLAKTASASQAGAESFTVPAGGRDAVIAFRGKGGPPDLVLRGPNGRTIVLPSQGMVRNPSLGAFRMDFDDTLYAAIRRPEPGRWTAVKKPGSPDIASIEYAAELPPIRFRGSVRKSGSRRVLRYRINPRKGQRVKFVEVAGGKAGQFLGTTTKARGRLAFTPADSNTRNRKIVAYVEQDGAPRDSFTVRFRAGNRPIGRPRELRARRRKSTLIVTWKAAKNAQRYRVFVSLSDGRKLFFDPGRRRRRLVIRRVAKRTTGTVSVVGERAGPRFGRKAKVKVRVVKAKKRKRARKGR